MTVTVREATPSDYPVIFDLIRNELGYQSLDKVKFLQRMALMETDANYVTIVAEADSGVVGFLGLHRSIAYNLDGAYIQIMALAVSERMQNQGIGKQLLSWTETYCRTNDIHKLTLNSNIRRSAAHALYERNGYSKLSYAFYKTL